MRFQAIHNGGNCVGCAYTQATGEITSETPKDFERYLASEQFPGSVRLHSPGGSLVGGIALGEALRANSIPTEVGSSQPLVNVGGTGLADRTPGECASACAYSFLGGTERTLDAGAKLGFHRFYQENSFAEPSAKLFTGKDLDDAQRISAALVFYVIKMGVDPRLVTLAAEAAPNSMRWIALDEARELRVIYEPWAFKPWRVEPYHGGAIAITDSVDGSKSIVASCSNRLGPNVALVDAKPTSDVVAWFDQCRKLELPGGHSVFGTRVNPSQIQITRRKDGGVVMRFRLPTNNPPLTSPSLLSVDNGYPRACSTNEYLGSRENFVPAVQLALRNCFQE